MAQYRKKPVVIEAFRLGVDPMPDWFCDARTRNDVITYGTADDWRSLAWAEIHTLEGVMRAEREDWIIRGVKGELYPCKPAIFEVKACLARMRRGEFTCLQLALTAELAGVPASIGPSYSNQYPATRLADRLIQRERKAGNIARLGRGWVWRSQTVSGEPT